MEEAQSSQRAGLLNESVHISAPAVGRVQITVGRDGVAWRAANGRFQVFWACWWTLHSCNNVEGARRRRRERRNTSVRGAGVGARGVCTARGARIQSVSETDAAAQVAAGGGERPALQGYLPGKIVALNGTLKGPAAGVTLKQIRSFL